MRLPLAKVIPAAALGAGAAASLALAIMVPATPAHAIVVFDPSNYSQNILTAARTLQQINNQVRMLQNQAQGLMNQARHLTAIGFPEMQAISTTLRRIDALMNEARSIDFRVGNLDRQYRRLFPGVFDRALTSDRQVMNARARLDAEADAYRQTMTIQAAVIENARDDARTLAMIAGRSQGAPGGLAAQQATNQLLALLAKQQIQSQTLVATQYRAQALADARRVQAESDARAITVRFLGSGTAYTPR
ncbi:P-type conjugative transfer protein TrbJ [Sphingomonas adhaesiva]|uniref:P-type conjugative transfer protein TrbJ n=1 Tax=Sphingomonas adhaesiva TaxID=28212 RepID=UPI002FFBC3D5